MEAAVAAAEEEEEAKAEEGRMRIQRKTWNFRQHISTMEGTFSSKPESTASVTMKQLIFRNVLLMRQFEWHKVDDQSDSARF